MLYRVLPRAVIASFTLDVASLELAISNQVAKGGVQGGNYSVVVTGMKIGLPFVEYADNDSLEYTQGNKRRYCRRNVLLVQHGFSATST